MSFAVAAAVVVVVHDLAADGVDRGCFCSMI